MSTQYTEQFYRDHAAMSESSAEEIVPQLVLIFRPHSVADVGCGVGTWLHVFNRFGINDVVGFDGDYVNSSQLRIESERFVACDLKERLPTKRRFDLAICLEVAEHLPENCARDFVKNLTCISDCIAFSAAIPHQGGTCHVNEQWPLYWQRLFEEEGFAVFDCIRDSVWNNAKVADWYAQNLLLFVRSNIVENYPELSTRARGGEGALSRVHPKLFERVSKQLDQLQQLKTVPPLRWALRCLVKSVASSIRWRLGQMSSWEQ